MKQLPYCVTWIVVLALVPWAAEAAGWSAEAALRALTNHKPKQALSAVRKRLADRPDDPGARFIKAVALADTGRLDDAVTVFEKLARQYPRRERIWKNLGVLYARQGQLDQARGALRRAIETATGDARTRENLGDVYVALADRAYRRAARQPGARSASARKQRALDGLVPSLSTTRAAARRIANAKHGAGSVGRPKTAKSETKPSSDDGEAVAKAQRPRLDQQIGRVLNRWAKAWSNQDVSAVMSVYSDDFRPSGDTTRAEWIKRQRSRVTAPKTVAMRVSHVQVQRESADRAMATFREHYQTPDHERDAKRQVVLVREDGDWRIVKSS